VKIKLLAAMVAAALTTNIYANEECNRSPRSVVYENSPVEVFISNDNQRAEVIFPEAELKGFNPEIREGVAIYPNPIPNKLAFQSQDPLYTGLVTVDGDSSKSYLIKLITRPGCADSQVTITNGGLVDRSQLSKDSRGRVKGLMNYLYSGKVPNGYRKNDFAKLTRDQRVVFRQGSVEFILQSQMVGPTYVGTTYEVINNGRTPFKVAIDQIDYSNKDVQASIGIARQAAMLPSSRVLGPSPEFISEVYGDSHRGLLFIVSEKTQ
jgi:hypothetical protein